MSFVAAAVGGSAVAGVGGAIINSNAAKDAAEKQANGAAAANGIQKQQWDNQQKIYGEARDQQRSDYEPWRTAGTGALSEMGSQDFKRDFTAADFQKDPGYEFRMAEGQKALERSAAARGGLQGGGTMKALSRYGQDYASGEYGKAYDRFNADRDRRFGRLSTLSGSGLQAAGGMANASGQYATNMGNGSMNYANGVSNNIMGNANSQAASSIAQGNAWSGALSSIGNAGMQGAAMGAGGGGGGMPSGGGASGGGSMSSMGYSGGRTYGMYGRQ